MKYHKTLAFVFRLLVSTISDILTLLQCAIEDIFLAVKRNLDAVKSLTLLVALTSVLMLTLVIWQMMSFILK